MMSLERLEALEGRLTKVFELVGALKEERSLLGEKVSSLEEENLRLETELGRVRERVEKLILSIEELGL